MQNNLENSVIRIVQDYCFRKKANILVHEFSITLAPRVTLMIQNEKISFDKFFLLAKTRSDFFHANEIEPYDFCKGLYRNLKSEIGFCIFSGFSDSILEFKRRMENGLAKTKGFLNQDEDTLRGALALFIQQESFLEARTSSGRSDLVIPSLKIIIETKIWKGEQYFNDGFPELESYLLAMHYIEGYYVIFDYNQNDNIVISANGEVFDHEYNSLNIHVIFVRMNKTAPSQIGRVHRKETTH